MLRVAISIRVQNYHLSAAAAAPSEGLKSAVSSWAREIVTFALYSLLRLFFTCAIWDLANNAYLCRLASCSTSTWWRHMCTTHDNQKATLYINSAQPAHALFCEPSILCCMCKRKKNEKRLIRLTSTCRCTTSPTHMTLWAFGNTVCQSVHMYAASGRYRARPRPQRSLCACEVCGCVGVGWACGSKSWPVYRPAERVRCVTCFANELSWPGRSVGWAY